VTFALFTADEEDAENEDDDNNDRQRDSNGNGRRPVNGSASNEEMQIIERTEINSNELF